MGWENEVFFTEYKNIPDEWCIRQNFPIYYIVDFRFSRTGFLFFISKILAYDDKGSRGQQYADFGTGAKKY